MTELIASPTLEKSIAKILYHTEQLVSEIDRLNAENNALREEIRLIRLNDGPMKNLTELEKDKSRLDWLTQTKRDDFGLWIDHRGFTDIDRQTIDDLAGLDATWLDTQETPANA